MTRKIPHISFKTGNLRIMRAEEYPREFVNQPCALYQGNKQLAIVGCGTSDDTAIAIVDGCLIGVLSYNDGLDYMGLEVFHKDGEQFGSCFMDGEGYYQHHFLSERGKIAALLEYINGE